MMNRRWFFTAAGSAFLASACAVVQQGPAGCPAGGPPPDSKDAQFSALLECFFQGLEQQINDFVSILPEERLPRRRENLERLFRPHLIAIYRERFNYRWEKGELPDKQYQLRLDQACVLGQLTGLAFRHEVGAVDEQSSFERPEALPRLSEKHLQWARDTYGFYTNPEVGKKHKIAICGESRQINEPCPFCQV